MKISGMDISGLIPIYLYVTFPSKYFPKQPRRLSSDSRAAANFSAGPAQGEFNLQPSSPYHFISNNIVTIFQFLITL